MLIHYTFDKPICQIFSAFPKLFSGFLEFSRPIFACCENFAQLYPQSVDKLRVSCFFQHKKIKYCLWITSLL